MHTYFDLSVSIPVLLVRLASALALGAVVAWRPFSRRPVKPEVSHALLLMTVAAAMVVVVIGDSMARAFGVVGLGSFIRFRSALKDPRDVVLFFLAIGTGMASGLGAVPVAAVGVAVVWATLILLDRTSPPEEPSRVESIRESAEELPAVLAVPRRQA
jgi:uncharacterized membrane protein YhiD involved in acid resistance